MSLKITLVQSREHILSGRLKSEEQVKYSILLPILQKLNWDHTKPNEIIPEYSVGSQRVDYALLGHEVPHIFIEAKKIGGVDITGEEQLFRYATNRGVPILILTDGNRWEFYLSMAEGEPSNRRFYRLQLESEDKIDEYADFLEKHLRKDLVISGEARRNAERLLESGRAKKRATDAIQKTWNALLNKPDEALIDRLSECVEIECGTMPDKEDVENFLKRLAYPTHLSVGQPTSPIAQPTSPIVQPTSPIVPPPPKDKIIGFRFNGKEYQCRSGINTLVQVLTEFSKLQPNFMETMASNSISHSKRLLALDPNDLFVSSPHLVETNSIQLTNGWWLGTNWNSANIRDHIVNACRVAGVKFGTELELITR